MTYSKIYLRFVLLFYFIFAMLFLLDWEGEWTYYLCECKMPDNGDYPPPEECRRDNPNRPANCPNIKDCLNTDNPPKFCFEICAKRKPPPKFCKNFAPPPETTPKSIVTTETGRQAVTSSPGPTRVVVVYHGSNDASSLTAHVFILAISIVFYVAFV